MCMKQIGEQKGSGVPRNFRFDAGWKFDNVLTDVSSGLSRGKIQLAVQGGL